MGSVADEISELRMRVLESILTGQLKHSAPRSSRKFKKEHGALLGEFRLAVDAALVTAAKEPDATARELLLAKAKQELTTGVDELSGAMRQPGSPNA